MATELAKAYVQIIPSATGIKAQLEGILGMKSAAQATARGKPSAPGWPVWQRRSLPPQGWERR
ncbi:MAG: hypothetical protein LUG65_04370 [Clostridiales bacterium]|nr:hypothetical protein [Clostridiales bacterium]